MRKEIPTFIISGFLGCGKTEFVKHFIEQYPNKKITVIENEVARLGIDGKISKKGNVDVIEINDGSISSSNLKNFEKVMKKIKLDDIDYLLVETSGAANLEPVLAVMKQFERLKIYVITVIDAKRFSQAEKLSSHTLDHSKHASILILNKCDLVKKTTRELQLRNLRQLNMKVISAKMCDVNFEKLMKEIRPVNLRTAKKTKSTPYLFLEIKKHWKLFQSKSERHKNINAYVYERYGLIDFDKLIAFIKKNTIPRAKGFIHLKDGKTYYFSTVGEDFTITKTPKQSNKKLNKIVLIGENIFMQRGSLQQRIRECIKKEPIDYLKDLLIYLQYQQNVPERVVYLK